jgi:Arc/MetJ family transcription regulator
MYAPKTTRIGAIIGALGGAMRATVSIDDELLKTAHEYTGVKERAEMIRKGLEALIAREAGRRLLALAGTAPDLKTVRRTRAAEQ